MNPTQEDLGRVLGVLLHLRVPDAEDTAAQAWLWAWEHRGRFDHGRPGKLTNWVLKIALGLRMNQRRAEDSRLKRETRWYYEESGRQ